jgi:hypothetical protein
LDAFPFSMGPPFVDTVNGADARTVGLNAAGEYDAR